jgi:hypothetical protein
MDCDVTVYIDGEAIVGLDVNRTGEKSLPENTALYITGGQVGKIMS